MSLRGKIKSYKIVLETLTEKSNVTLSLIQKNLEVEWLPYSLRTVQRIIEELRIEFELNVAYNKNTRCYELKDEQSYFLKKLHLFKLLAVSETYHELLKDPANKIKHIDFDTSYTNTGIEYFHPVFKAIDGKKCLKITYQAFDKQQAKTHEVCPLLLKEYLNRWYLLGRTEGGFLLIFCLDRISNIVSTKKKFTIDKKFNPETNFEHIIGITITDKPVKEIILSFTPQQGRYVKTQPLHPSQETVIDNENEFRIRLYLQPNYELNALILSHGPEVMVIEPLNLREEIKERLEATLSLYK